MAFALTLGVACKKNEVVQPDHSVSKKEVAVKDFVKPVTSSLVNVEFGKHNNPCTGPGGELGCTGCARMD